MLTKTICLSILALLVVNCQNKAINPIKEPLIINNFIEKNKTWQYDLITHFDTVSLRFPASYNVIGDTLISNIHYFTTVAWEIEDSNSYIDTTLLSYSNDSLKFNGGSSTANPITSLWKKQLHKAQISPTELLNRYDFFTNGRLFYKFPITINRSWTDSPWVAESTFTELKRTFTVIREETVVVPAGSFDCLLIDIEYQWSGHPLHVYDWVSKSGIIKRSIDYGQSIKYNETADSIGVFHVKDTLVCKAILYNNGAPISPIQN